MMEHHRLFEVSFRPPTNTKGPRVCINDLRQGVRKYIPDESGRHIAEQAAVHLAGKGIECVVFGVDHNKGRYILTTTNFQNSIR